MKYNNYIKGLFLVFIYFQISLVSGQDLRLIVSRINSQEVFTNSKIEVFFSSLNNTSDVNYSCPNLPSFGKVISLNKGYGKFIFEPDDSDIGEYHIILEGDKAANGAKHSQEFILEVKGVDSNKTYFIDPINGNDLNSGDSESPFKTIDKITKSSFNLIGGTVIYLKSGNYGSPDFSRFNTEMVFVVAEKGQTPMAERIRFNFANNWTISGMKISPSVASKTNNGKYVQVPGGTKNIVIKNCEIYGTPNILDWPKNSDWENFAGNGIECTGKNCSFINNYIYNTDFPVQIFGTNNDVSYNVVTNFAGDAFRSIGHYNSFTFNQIKNAVVFDYYDNGGNHDDAFQSWTLGNPVLGIKIIGNQITDISYPELPLQTEIMQGIVDFDGFAEDWIVQDNLLAIHHQHGISILGARNCKIVNNTIVKNPFKLYNPGNPWIGIWSTKPAAGSLKSTGNLVRNNIMGSFTDSSPPAPQGLKDPGDIDHNFATPHFNNIFIDYNEWDFHLKANTIAIDRGEKEDASYSDIEGFIRNKGKIDLGCFERDANESDFENPSDIGDISIDEFGPTHAKLSWTAANDNKGIKLYHILYEDQEIIVNEPKVFITDLYSENDYTFKIYGEDLVGNKTNVKSVKISTPEFDNVNYTIYAGGLRTDQEITNKNNKKWSFGQYLKVGGTDSKTDLVGVIVFRIPSTPPSKKIIGANLSLVYDKRVGFPTGNVDLYGLDYERKALIKKDIFWQGEYNDSDAIGIPLSNNFIGQTMSSGLIKSDSITSNNILKYLNTQLENGAHGNNYLFLRLNVDVNNEVKDAYYNFLSADNYSSFKRPLLTFILDHETKTEDLGTDNISIYPNPVYDKLNISNINSKSSFEIIDMYGKTYMRNSLQAGIKNQSILISKLISGIYFIKIDNGTNVIIKKFIKI